MQAAAALMVAGVCVWGPTHEPNEAAGTRLFEGWI